MKIRFKDVIGVSACLLSTFNYSCITESLETRTITIKSKLEFSTKFRVFHRGNLVNPNNRELNESGILFENTETNRGGSTTDFLLGGDSIIIIMNDDRKDIHWAFENVSRSGRNMFDEASYESDGLDLTYTITQEDYENATPCDGPCE